MEDLSKTFIRSVALLNIADNRLSIEFDALQNQKSQSTIIHRQLGAEGNLEKCQQSYVTCEGYLALCTSGRIDEFVTYKQRFQNLAQQWQNANDILASNLSSSLNPLAATNET